MATTSQDKALDDALALLGEHFDHVVILADAPDVEFPNEDDPSIFTRRKGSTWTAKGMMDTYKTLIDRAFLKSCDREDEQTE